MAAEVSTTCTPVGVAMTNPFHPERCCRVASRTDSAADEAQSALLLTIARGTPSLTSGEEIDCTPMANPLPFRPTPVRNPIQLTVITGGPPAGSEMKTA